MTMEAIILIAVGALLSLLVVGAGLRRRRWRIGSAAAARLRVQWDAACAQGDPARRVLECDSVLSLALREAGVPGGLGAQLRIAGARFANREALWRAHKLRNRIAHEPGTKVAEREADAAVKAFERGMESVLR